MKGKREAGKSHWIPHQRGTAACVRTHFSYYPCPASNYPGPLVWRGEIVLKARDLMSTDLKEVEESATVEKAARIMVEANVSSLVVRPAEKGEPWGIITTRDVVNAIAEGKDVTWTRVNEVASSPLVVVTPGVPVPYVARLMKRSGLRHIAVFNGREVVGMLSNVDIVRAVATGTLEVKVSLEAPRTALPHKAPAKPSPR
jgi:CBS domain-containing protein